jgi:predicted nucleic acid-binding protein
MYRQIIIDTSYLLPMFGVQIDTADQTDIQRKISLIMSNDIIIGICDISLIEGFGKASRLAQKQQNEDGYLSAVRGYIDLLYDNQIKKYSTVDVGIFNEAQLLRRKHNDLFDCFIFGTALYLKAILLTEDNFAHKEIKTIEIWNWQRLTKELAI